MKGDVPTPFGKVHVEMDKQRVTVKSDGGCGTLTIGKKSVKIPAGTDVTVEYNK